MEQQNGATASHTAQSQIVKRVRLVGGSGANNDSNNNSRTVKLVLTFIRRCCKHEVPTHQNKDRVFLSGWTWTKKIKQQHW